MDDRETVLIIDDDRFDEHNANTDLPETPYRTAHIRNALKTRVENGKLRWVPPREADWDLPESVHAKHYVQHVRKQCNEADRFEVTRMISNNSEVCVSKNSGWAVLHAVSAAVQAVDTVFSHRPEENRFQRVFCNTRPPGHHAYKGQGMGFCIFNNVWIAANHALNHYGENWDNTPGVAPYTPLNYEAVTGLPRHKRVVVLDWDVHHGNGTEDFVNNANDFISERLLYVGTQQNYKTIWPSTGKPCEDAGQHHNINRFNFEPGDGDEEVKEMWESKILPKIREFDPHLILISCGFDAHIEDPIGQLNFSSEVYGWMTTKLREICPRIISILEGGYNCEAISEAAVQHIKALT